MKAMGLVLSMTLTAGCVGGLLALAGTAASPQVVEFVGLTAVLVVVTLGLTQLVSGRTVMLQFNRETSAELLYLGPYRWAIVNGALLGLGFTSRIAFVGWYLVPAAAFLMPSVLLGAVAFGLYGLSRGLVTVAAIPITSGRDNEDRFTPMLQLRRVAEQVALGSAAMSAGVLGGILGTKSGWG